jgi:NADH-quinone oxidoreductase subunit L
MITWLLTSVILLPWLGAIIVWAAGNRRPRIQHSLACLISLLAGIASLALLTHTSHQTLLRIPVGGVFGDLTLVPDALGVSLAVVATVVGSLAVVFSVDYMRGDDELGRYYSLVLLFIGAMAGLVLSGSLLFMFIFWEITAFCSYALISFHNDDPKAVAGGMKALIMTQLGGVGLLGGALLGYAHFGDYQISTFIASAAELPPQTLKLAAFGFLIAAAAKSAQIPFQTWLPDAMEAPTPVTALIHAATMVNAGVYLLARFFPAFSAVPGWTTAVIIIGMLSALLAAVMAVLADDLKRALAYSTVSQLGYMVYAVGAGAVFASQYHLLSHSLFKALLFLGAGAVIHSVETRDMRQMGGLRREMPFTHAAFLIGSLGLVGLPIANGFFSKELVLEGGLAGGPLWAYVAMLFSAGITALYAVRMVTLVFYGDPRSGRSFRDAPLAMRISLSVLSVGTLTSWLLGGEFSSILAASLPLHHLTALTTGKIVSEILRAPAAWLALTVIFMGIMSWRTRARFSLLTRRLKPLAEFAGGGLGFEKLNTWAIELTKQAAALLGSTQTGHLSWNIVGLLVGLAVILAVLSTGV